MADLTPILGLLAGAVGIVDTVPYVRDMLRGLTRPHRGTWLIWGVLAVVAFVSQRADGGSWSLVMTGTQAVLTGLVFLLAIRHGEGGLSQSAGVTVTPGSAGPTLSSLSLSPTTVTGGTSSTATVTLSSAAPSGGRVVALSSSNTAAATVPAALGAWGEGISRAGLVTLDAHHDVRPSNRRRRREHGNSRHRDRRRSGANLYP